ncbi:hypothetical protein GSI_09934 [Ganoderma sinense ZZ0214-1]|uniref:Uncharacterized protein n=1 Tax=Ganoderma sinense ZZ0214-1 TaxID=1077348 RepID=A0A2G8S2J0_9APHY|nr:hypothetical protein GSI_09934 [Ganoderma sinense ZZ0214-1]
MLSTRSQDVMRNAQVISFTNLPSSQRKGFNILSLVGNPHQTPIAKHTMNAAYNLKHAIFDVPIHLSLPKKPRTVQLNAPLRPRVWTPQSHVVLHPTVASSPVFQLPRHRKSFNGSPSRNISFRARHQCEHQTAADRRRRSLRVSSPVEGIGLGGFDTEATVPPAPLPPPPTSPVALAPAAGCNVTVVDLHPLLTSASSSSSSSAQPEPVAQITFPRPQALSALKFSPDGTSLALCSKDGHVIRVLQLRPAPHGHAPRLSSSQWSRRTTSCLRVPIQVFVTNPLGGNPDGSSHLSGKVVNGRDLVSSSTELSPLVRVRLKSLSPDSAAIPMRVHVPAVERGDDPPVAPPPSDRLFFYVVVPVVRLERTLQASRVLSPAQRPTRLTNYKNMLVFDRNDGTLTLHRIFVDRAPADQAVVRGSIPVVRGTYISLPGMSTFSHHMDTSPPEGSEL